MNYKSNSLHILVVEDHLGDYILIEDYLREEHSQIQLTRGASFKEAQEKLNSLNIFDAILLDLSLPDSLDAETLVNDIISLAKKTPVIVLTGNSNKSFGVKTLSLGISDYLLKDELNASQLSKSIFYSIERKKTEIKLSESEKKYKSLFNLSPMPMWVLDRYSLNVLSVNDAALELYGYSREEFLKLNVRDLWANSVEPEIENVVETERHDFFNFTISHKIKSGEIIHLEIKSNSISFDGKDARVTLVNNVTARLEAEKALVHNEKRFRALVQETSDLVMILDFQGNFSYISPSSKSVLGISAEILQNNNFFNIIHPEDVVVVKEYIIKLRHQKRVQVPSYRIKTAQKSWRWIETVLTNLSEDPAVNGIVANSRDITDFVLQERKLRESLQRYDIVAKATSDTITDYDV